MNIFPRSRDPLINSKRYLKISPSFLNNLSIHKGFKIFSMIRISKNSGYPVRISKTDEFQGYLILQGPWVRVFF